MYGNRTCIYLLYDYIKWKWNYETGSNPTEIASNDKIDTQNAQEITNYEFDVIVSGTQVVPQA